MKKLLYLFLVVGLAACGSPEVADFSMSGVQVSGEFLFEGPNTLQGKQGPIMEQLASSVGVPADQVKAVYLKSATVSFEMDTLREGVQSALLQWVSNDLEMVGVATKSPLPAADPVTMDVSQENDLLPYLQDPESTVILDVNLAQDLDELAAKVDFVFSVEYKK